MRNKRLNGKEKNSPNLLTLNYIQLKGINNCFYLFCTWLYPNPYS